MSIKFTLSDPKCYPVRATEHSGGIDLKSAKPTTVLEPGQKSSFGTGVSIEIPIGYVGLVIPRSGLGTKWDVRLANTVGVIDADYRGEIICWLTNKGDKQLKIDKYDRIAQLIIVPCLIEDFILCENLSTTERGTNGFGSTGK